MERTIGARVPGTRTTDDADLGGLLEVARAHLGMDVAFVGRFDGAHRVVDAVAAADPTESAALVGVSAPSAGTYCQRIVDGRLAAVTPDVARVAELQQLPVTGALRIGSYLGVPVTGPDGQPYGTVCAYSHTAAAQLTERHADALRFVAGVLEQRLAATAAASGRWDVEVQRAQVQALLDTGQPEIVLQPIVRLTSGAVTGFEALARFAAGPPDEMFAAAHACGLGVELELQAASNALWLLRAVRADLTISINIGLAALVDDRFLALLDRVPASRVRWELTEHEADVDRQRVAARLSLLRQNGFGIAMDDVGAGYAGLDRLLAVDPETIKLDRALVHGVDTDPARRALLGATASYAQRVGATVVAEGIESEGERRAVHELGIAYGQGYGIGRPCGIRQLPPAYLAA